MARADYGPIHFHQHAGPYRLGVRLVRLHTDTELPIPEFWSNWKLEYHWFADEYTKVQATFGGVSFEYFDVLGPFDPSTPNPGLTPQDRGQQVGGIGLGYNTHGEDPVLPRDPEVVRFTGVNIDGPVDFSEINDPGHWIPAAGGLQGMMPDPGSASVNIYPPFNFQYFLDISKFGGESTHARVLDQWYTVLDPDSHGIPRLPHADFIQVPFVHTWSIRNVSWHERTTKKGFGGLIQFDLQPAWAAEQDPPIPFGDRQVPIYGSPARFDPSSVAPYFPIRFLVKPVEVHRPNGLMPSQWTSSDTAKMDVTEELADTIFVVEEEGAYAERVLSTHWRNWTTVGDPRFGMTLYEVTKHDYLGPGDDVFGWQHHAWLKLVIDAPQEGDLTLRVDGVHFEVTDPHVTSLVERTAGYTRTETPFVVSYDFHVVAGANTVFIDLLYPTTGATGPFYYGRVDRLRLSGFKIGNYTLTEMRLEPREQTYLKIDFGEPVQRGEEGDYDAPVFAQDGSYGLGEWPDQFMKTEIGLRGGGVRAVEPLTGSGTGLVLDVMRSLKDFWENLHKLEGILATYNSEIYLDANRDEFGQTLAPETAEWAWNLVPYARLSQGGGAPYPPSCSPRIKQLSIANGTPFSAYVQWNLWAGIESMVTVNGARAPAGTAVSAMRVDNGATYTGFTDSMGYAVIWPVPGHVQYSVP